MRNEQEYNDRNRGRHRDWDRDRYNQHRGRHPEHQQNASNRWGEPDPRMGPHDDEWQRTREEQDRFGDFTRNDWRPFEQRDNRHFYEEDRRYGNRHEQPEWQRRDQHFSNENQHANDRWSSGREMPHQHNHHHPRHASERFYREQRRRYY